MFHGSVGGQQYLTPRGYFKNFGVGYTRASSAEFCYPKPLKTIPFAAAHTYIAHIWQYPPPPGGGV